MLSVPLRSRLLRQTCMLAARYTSNEVTKAKPVEVIAQENNLPIERTSLSRGLALNRFEKDFMIYPEYSDAEDVDNIKKFSNKVRDELVNALSDRNVHATGISDEILSVLLKNGIFHGFVPKEYEGAGLSTKDLLCVNEALGVDLSTFVFVNQTYIATRLIQLYGTEEQKSKYLPKLASFQLKPAMCMQNPLTGEITEVVGFHGGESKVHGYKSDVINADIADIFFVFSNELKNKGTGESAYNCYLIDKSEIGDGQITISETKVTHGLKGINISKVHFANIPARKENLIGGYNGGHDAANEIMSYGNFYLGSAVVGFLKNMLEELANYANAGIVGNRRLAENVAVQRALSETGMNTFVLESIIYYLGGLMDEGLVLSTDIENAIVQRYVNRVLREAFVSVTQVAGTTATQEGFPYDKMTRDMNTLLSLNVNDLSLVKSISLSMIVSWVEATSFESRFAKANTLKRLLNINKRDSNWNNPKLKHFIAEHVHPSLEVACRKLENTMSRLDVALNRIVEDAGSRVKEDVATLWSLSTVLENNLAMVATIARASRSYSIGLRNADIELAWAIAFCHSAARQSESELEFLMDHFGLLRKNPSLVNVGAAVVEFGGYPIERPIERNW
uniref:Acyl-CoA_dh_N domain-containing protein n=1 Tax=Panagrellus redivivus TaxID=6233 RepID=A0A7E4VCD6_PANRE